LLICCLPANILGEALWSDEFLTSGASSSEHFQPDGFGNYILDRGRVISAVNAAVDEQLIWSPDDATSVYLHGCQGMGKTSLLHLLARDLKTKNWEVYWYTSAEDIPLEAGDAFLTYAEENSRKKIAVIVDDVYTKPDHPLFATLLTNAPSNILTVGAAADYRPSELAAVFKTVFQGGDLMLQKDDDDLLALIEYWKKHEVVVKNEVTPAMVDYVTEFLLDYCGGHTYPILAFMEHFFALTNHEQAKEFLSSEGTFERYSYGEEFSQSDVFVNVRSRCFEELYDFYDPHSARNTFDRVMSGQGRREDITTLTRLGWWLPKKNYIVSTLLLNEYMLTIRSAGQQQQRRYYSTMPRRLARPTTCAAPSGNLLSSFFPFVAVPPPRAMLRGFIQLVKKKKF
jgi:hypothetical protein